MKVLSQAVASLAKSALVGIAAGAIAGGATIFFVPRASAEWVASRPLWDLSSRWQLVHEINPDIVKAAALPIALVTAVPTWLLAFLIFSLSNGLTKREREILAIANRTTIDPVELIQAAQAAKEWQQVDPVDILKGLGIK